MSEAVRMQMAICFAEGPQQLLDEVLKRVGELEQEYGSIISVGVSHDVVVPIDGTQEVWSGLITCLVPRGNE